MSKFWKTFAYGDPLPSAFVNALQEYISTLTSNLNVTKLTATSVQQVAGTSSALVAVGINGLWRYNTATVTAAMPGSPAAGTYNLWAVASANNIATDGTDNTDYSWGLQILAVGVNPSGNWNANPITAYRQLGTVDWDGTQITAVRQTVGGAAQPHAATHAPGAYDALDYPAVAQYILLRGTRGARPAASAANNGFLYFASDEQIVYRSTGTGWEVWSGAGAGRYSGQIGDGSATQFDVGHSLGTQNVAVFIRETNPPYRQVFPEIQALDANTTRVIFDTAPAAGAYTAVIIGGNVGTAVVGVSQYVAPVGDGVNATITFTHNLGSRDGHFTLRQNAAPYSEVTVEAEHTDANTVTLRFATAPTSGQYVGVFTTGQNRVGAASVHASQHLPGGSDPLIYPVVTSLPGGPVDGQECFFLADAVNGIVWHLKYRAASASAYKWEFVGGVELAAANTSSGTRAAGAGYGALTGTTGPSIITPLAGDYEVGFGARLQNSTAGAIAGIGVQVGATAITDDNAAVGAENGNAPLSVWRSKRFSAVAAATTLQTVFTSSTGTATVSEMELRARPVRVG